MLFSEKKLHEKRNRSFRLPAELYTALAAEAARQHRSVNNLVYCILSEWAEGRKNEDHCGRQSLLTSPLSS